MLERSQRYRGDTHTWLVRRESCLGVLEGSHSIILGQHDWPPGVRKQ